jgi:hypothetical protein
VAARSPFGLGLRYLPREDPAAGDVRAIDGRFEMRLSTGTLMQAALWALAAGAAGCAGPAGAPRAATLDLRGAASTQVAGSVAAFVDTAGVNVHLGNTQSEYFRNPQRIEKLLTELGAHHLRDGTYPDQPDRCAQDAHYGARGIYFDYIVTPAETDAQLQAWQNCSAPSADAYENYNEYDEAHDPNWIAVLQAAQLQIDDFVPSTGAISLGPALTSEADYGAVGPLVAGGGNMHDYFAGRNPGTPGWGSTDAFGTYGSLAYNIAIAQQTTGSAPMWATETGYGDAPGSQYALPPAIKMHYTLRTLFEHWNAGVARTYFYELVDEDQGPFGSYGLANDQAEPKPAFTALAALLAHLAGRGSQSARLDIRLQALSAVHHTLLAKGDGTFVLALWQEVQEWNPLQQRAMRVVPLPVTIWLDSRPHGLTRTIFGPDGVPASHSLPTSAHFSLSIDGGVTLVDIAP